jgi:hypothetical protein
LKHGRNIADNKYATPAYCGRTLIEERWNGTDGKTHAKVSIVAEHVEFRPEAKTLGKGDETVESETCDEDMPLAVGW